MRQTNSSKYNNNNSQNLTSFWITWKRRKKADQSTSLIKIGSKILIPFHSCMKRILKPTWVRCITKTSSLIIPRVGMSPWLGSLLQLRNMKSCLINNSFLSKTHFRWIVPNLGSFRISDRQRDLWTMIVSSRYKRRSRGFKLPILTNNFRKINKTEI